MLTKSNAECRTWKRSLGMVFFMFFLAQLGYTQSFRFALVTDTHVGGATSVEDLQKTVEDLNVMNEAAFAIFSGDITEFGSDEV